MNMTRTIKTTILLLTSVALLWGAPSMAGAADCDVLSPTADQYCPPQTVIERGSNSSGSGSDPSASASTGGLPFTGYDIGLAALVATGLVGAGIGLNRAARADAHR